MSLALTGVDLAWDTAREVAHAAAGALPAVVLPLAEAAGATLAAPLVALTDLPSGDRSAMDGFAVRGTPPWTVVGELRAGDAPTTSLLPGTAVVIATGAPVPAGTDAVVPVEVAVTDGETVAPLGPFPARVTHIRRRGEECSQDDVLVPAGAVVTPQVAGLAAAIGHDVLTVATPPRFATLVTGNEVQAAGAPAPGQVRDAIGPMLPGLIRWVGGVPTGTTLVRDSRAMLATALATAEADVIVVSGSSSAGRADHLRPCLAELGAELLVDGVACRPGHPQSLARLPDGRVVVGLPGNPLAALTAFLTLAVPLTAGLTGRALPPLATAAADGLTAHPGLTKLVPVRVRGGVASAVRHAGSAMLRGVALADAVAVVPPATTPPTTVELLPLPG